jgi:hypothetical protein
VAGVFKSIWQLMTGKVIDSADLTVHNGQTKITLAARRAKSGVLFVSFKHASSGNTQWLTFEPSEFNQFVAAVDLIYNTMASEARKSSENSN